MEIVESLAPGKAMLQIAVIKPFEARNTVEFSARRILERKELLSLFCGRCLQSGPVP